ncbi:hypothetical protein GE09DRAFT_1220215 [Coniochaeta sp. 2T2.1]|nr:hypothetical protein GE09DRAFT_1220215 [Coniochaeta sp. 2T2.1]
MLQPEEHLLYAIDARAGTDPIDLPSHSRYMYIPLPLPLRDTPAPAPAQVGFGQPGDTSEPGLQEHQTLHDFLHSVASALTHFFTASRHDNPELRKRDPLKSTNVTVGAVVGVLLGVILLGTIYFCVRYHRGIKFTDKKRRRHRRGGSSRGSKASTASSSSTAPAPPAPPAPPPAAAAG